MGFEKFDGGGRGRSSSGPMISLRKSGSIGINGAAMSEYFEDAEAAVLYYDEDDNQVGLERVDDTDADGAYTISRTNDTGSVTPSAFLNRYDLVPDITTQFEPEVSETDDGLELVTIDLDEPIGTYGSPEDEDAEDAEADDAEDEE
ncbi:hypothetical protein HWV07_07175 [Natronomonas salina]|uniref:hypothetical protein n=1 Tax=Natronomonas salina TaxID=1710540 RepID=UPI0015B5CFA0|nr:hypothetical protein [Natronomonas salina]QLD88827.1 hypothetical protein HWV07_07175 [Natronomonas salina]